MTPPRASTSALDRLRTRVEALGAPLCVGIDPHPDALPDGLSRDVDGIETFARGVVEAVADQAAALKVNLAFFEAFGSRGLAALERLRADVPAEHVLILDAKRGDVPSTAERQATALFGHLAADGVTLSPYLGEDAIEPFAAYPGRLIYVLARTSNPSAPRLQGLAVEPGMALGASVAAWVAERWGQPEVGLVVGATAPADLLELREQVQGPAFLVPGVGAQGGDLASAVRACHGRRAPGLVNITRGISSAAQAGDWRAAVAEAAGRWRALMAEVGATLAP